MKLSWFSGALLGALFSPTLLLIFYRQVITASNPSSTFDVGAHPLTPLSPIFDFCASVLVGALMVRWLSEDPPPRFGVLNAVIGGAVSGFYGYNVLRYSADQSIYEGRDVILFARLFTYAPLVFGALSLFVVGSLSRLPPTPQLELRHRFLWIGGALGGAVLLQLAMWGCLSLALRTARFLPHTSDNCIICIDPVVIFTDDVSPKYLLVGAGLGFLSTALCQSRLRLWNWLSALYGVGLCLSIVWELRSQWLFLAPMGSAVSDALGLQWISNWFLTPPFVCGLILVFFDLPMRWRPAEEEQ